LTFPYFKYAKVTFLKLWSDPNPYKDDGHEFCELLAVFDNHVFIFFDRQNALPEIPDKDPQVLWDRWKRNMIDRQVKAGHGAERYIRSGRPIFLDQARRLKGYQLVIAQVVRCYGMATLLTRSPRVPRASRSV